MCTRKILLGTGAALLLAIGPAFATHPTMPKQFQGAWCGDKPMHRCNEEKEGVDFHINSTSYFVGANWECTFTSIKFNKLQNAVNVDATCESGHYKAAERAIFLVENDTLTFMTLELRDDKQTK